MSSPTPEFIIQPLVDQDGPAARISLEMKEYLEALKAYQKSKASSDKAAQLEISSKSIRELHSNLSSNLMGVLGQDLWDKTKEKMIASAVARKEQRAISAMEGTKEGRLPLALEAMAESCVEIIKNSMDALIYQYLRKPDSAPTTMTLDFELTCPAGTELAQLSITDNGGGFPESYLAKQAERKTKEGIMTRYSSDKTSSESYFFGGRGLGLRLFFGKVLFGQNIHSHLKAEQIYDFSVNPTTDIRLSNVVKDGATGACITIVSPIVPIPKLSRDFSPSSFSLATMKDDEAWVDEISGPSRGSTTGSAEEKRRTTPMSVRSEASSVTMRSSLTTPSPVAASPMEEVVLLSSPPKRRRLPLSLKLPTNITTHSFFSPTKDEPASSPAAPCHDVTEHTKKPT